MAVYAALESPALARRLAVITAVSTLLLIGVGVYVRASGSGLGCPDWPLCHGQVIPPTESHHTLIEFSHRLVASAVGVMVIALAVVAWHVYRRASFLLGAAIAVVPLVGIQGLLGAITVWRELPADIVASHLVLAMVILGIIVAIAVASFAEDASWAPRVLKQRRAFAGPVAVWAGIALVWLAAVMWLGAYTAESGAATACTGWPGCNGSLLPGNDQQEITHMLHRSLAAMLLGPLGAAASLGFRRGGLVRGWAVFLASLYALQVLLGAFNVWYEFPDGLTVSHTIVAATIWSLLVGGAAIALYRPSLAPGDARPPREAAA